MGKIITAITNETLIKKLYKNKITEEENIWYKEAIIEIIKKDKNINILIISENLPGEINFFKLIKNIYKINNKIKIIILLKNKTKKEEINKLNIYKIYSDNYINNYKIIKEINKNKTTKKDNKKINKYIIKKRKNKIIEGKNIIIIFGKKYIDKKIVELMLIRKINKNIKIIKLNLDIKEFLKNEINKKIENIKQKYKNKKYYIIINIKNAEDINKLPIFEEYINILAIENNINNLIEIKNYKKTKNNLILIINNYSLLNISKYFYFIFKNKFIKIKILNNFLK